MSNLPIQTTPVFATDENIAVRAGGDFAVLCPPWQQMAAGIDGAFANGSPWVLTSATVNFGTNGVSANQVVWLTAPKANYPGGGQFLAIESVSAGAITLRRLHKGPGVGQPPAPAAGLAGVAFAIGTLDAQIEEASFALKRRYGIDENNWGRSSNWVYDLRDLRIATVLTVLRDRYTQETRTERGDFAMKAQRIDALLNEVLGRVEVRWGQFGNSSEPSSLFACRVARG